MSISLSVYDVFANLIPGLFYLFAINELLRATGFQNIDPANLTSAPQTLGVLAIAYILGHIFNSFTYRGWYLLFNRSSSNHDRDNLKSDSGKALNSLQRQYPELGFKGFHPRDTDMLFNAIQIKNKELADRIEITRVTAIMMRNISFGLFLIGAVEVFNAITGRSLYFSIVALACFIGSALALSQTSKYYYWFFKDVFRIGLLHGQSLQDLAGKIRDESISKLKKEK